MLKFLVCVFAVIGVYYTIQAFIIAWNRYKKNKKEGAE